MLTKYVQINVAANSAAMYPLESLLSVTCEGNTKLKMRFKSSKPLSQRLIDPKTAAVPAQSLSTNFNDSAGDPIPVDLAGAAGSVSSAVAAVGASITAGAIAYDEIIFSCNADEIAAMDQVIQKLAVGGSTNTFVAKIAVGDPALNLITAVDSIVYGIA